MKPKEYVKKYRLDCADSSINKDELLADLSNDFIAMIEYLKGANQLNYTRFGIVKNDFWQKIESLKRQTKTDPSLFNEVRQTIGESVVDKIEQEVFGAYLKQQKEERARRRQEQAEMRNAFFGTGPTLEDFLLGLLLDRWGKTSIVPQGAFQLLELPENSNPDEISKRYREKSMTCHPDKDGNAQDFIKLTEAKNRCLAYARSHSG